MAQTIVTLCDTCLSEGTETRAVTWAVAITPPGARKPQTFSADVCELHSKPYADMLADLSDTARPATTAPAKVSEVGSHPCPLCEYVGRTKSGLASHLKNTHDTTAGEAFGTADMPCPVKGCKRAFTRAQGVAVHLSRKHPDYAA